MLIETLIIIFILSLIITLMFKCERLLKHAIFVVLIIVIGFILNFYVFKLLSIIVMALVEWFVSMVLLLI